MTIKNSPIPHIDANDGADAISQALDEAGIVVVERAASPQEAHAAAFDLAPYLKRTPNGEGRFYGMATKRCGALVKKSATLAEWSINETILEVVERALRPACDRIQFNATQAISIQPGEKAQYLHRDEQLFSFVPNLSPRFEVMVDAIWAVTPFTEENGATRAIPGSHKWPLDREPEPGQCSPALMEPGDVVLFLGSTLHAGGANRSTAPRTGAAFAYSLGWLRQTENLLLSVPWEDAQHFPERLQRLLGYQVHRPSLGWVEGIDPLEWLKAGKPDVGAARDIFPEEILALVEEVTNTPEAYPGRMR